MNNFQSGDIGGDVVIIDQSDNRKNEYKLLIHCTNEELIEEKEHRQKLLRNERSRKSKITMKFLAVAAFLMLFAAVWYFIKGQMDFVSLAVGLGGALMTSATIQGSDKVTEFEVRQLQHLREIEMLLREREVK